MRKYIYWYAILSCGILFAQNKVAEKISELQTYRTIFSPVNLFVEENNIEDNDINKVVSDAFLTTLNIAKTNQLVADKKEYIELAIPYKNQTVSLLLYRVNPMAEGFHVDTDKGKNINYEKGLYYRGIIKGDSKSVATFNFFNGECNGIFSSVKMGNIVIGKLKKTGNKTRYIVYSDSKMNVLNQFDCHVKESELLPAKNKLTSNSTLSARCASIYFEVDNDIFLSNNSSETDTTNWLTSVFNNIQTLYANDGITVAIKSIFIWTVPDPYNGIGTTSYEYLTAFAANTPIFDGDLGQLVGIDPGGLGGVAISINGLCSQNNYSYSDVDIDYATVPTFSWTVQVMTHELGHLLGSPHTHGCYWNGNDTAIDGCGPTANSVYTEGNCATGPLPLADEGGTIMSYCHLVAGIGINLANGFGPQPSALILDTVTNSSCLSTDCINTCINMVTDIEIIDVSNNSVAISWNDGGNATSWQVAVTPFQSTDIVWNSVSTTNYSVSGLSPNTYYIVRVRPVCSGDAISASKETIFATSNDNLCNFVFTDTGGSTSNYTDMESWVRTMMPAGTGLKIKASFTSFNLENTYDFLYIFNGPNEFYPDLTSGGLTGLANPGVFNSTDITGALTFKFYSDQAENRSGWVANITCTGTLGENSNEFIDFSYYPNPTSGNVTIFSKDNITAISIYNVQGQQLFYRKLNELNANVDMSKFAAGTYFFNLKFNDKTANFKILKL